MGLDRDGAAAVAWSWGLFALVLLWAWDDTTWRVASISEGGSPIVYAYATFRTVLVVLVACLALYFAAQAVNLLAVSTAGKTVGAARRALAWATSPGVAFECLDPRHLAFHGFVVATCLALAVCCGVGDVEQRGGPGPRQGGGESGASCCDDEGGSESGDGASSGDGDGDGHGDGHGDARAVRTCFEMAAACAVLYAVHVAAMFA